LVDLGVTGEIIQKAGSWYSYGGDRIGQGKDNVKVYLKEHPEVARSIATKVREQAFGQAAKDSGKQLVDPSSGEDVF
jgi:recombination protein RecA